MGKFKTLVCQDDCAPDSLEKFKMEFLNITGETLEQFKDRSDFADDFTLTWTNKDGYRLSIAPDDPYYRLDLLTKTN